MLSKTSCGKDDQLGQFDLASDGSSFEQWEFSRWHMSQKIDLAYEGFLMGGLIE